MGSSVEIQGLTRHFRGADRAAVEGLDLRVEPGRTLCIVGPSGCGKSTTLRIVAGLDHPDGGRVLIDGNDMLGVEPQARDVAMVFQGFALYPHMTVAEILAFPLKMRRISRVERERTVGETAELLGLTPLLGRTPGQLSGGERQRVAMGRAIVRRPKVFLFDEPLSNLDASLRAELRVELGRLLRRLEATALYVTHDQAEAMTLGDDIALLQAGKLIQIASPRRIYEQPETVFCASFFGAPPMNLVELDRDGPLAVRGGVALPVPNAAPAKLTAGIRPEHVEVGEAPHSADTVTFPAKVTGVEPLGAESHVDLDADGVALRARVDGFASVSRGDVVAVTLRPSRVCWFNRASGRAL